MKTRLGRKIKLYRDVERFPDFIAQRGMTGTIVHDQYGTVSAKIDQHIKGCEEWNNEIWWTLDHDQIFESDIFHNQTLANATT